LYLYDFIGDPILAMGDDGADAGIPVAAASPGGGQTQADFIGGAEAVTQADATCWRPSCRNPREWGLRCCLGCEVARRSVLYRAFIESELSNVAALMNDPVLADDMMRSWELDQLIKMDDLEKRSDQLEMDDEDKLIIREQVRTASPGAGD